uniref:Uncharacterized protein n=1 Tax=Rhizophora mucronata TaxID=61149 RepID=A0A2P2PEI4_RHIMU
MHKKQLKYYIRASSLKGKYYAQRTLGMRKLIMGLD